MLREQVRNVSVTRQEMEATNARLREQVVHAEREQKNWQNMYHSQRHEVDDMRRELAQVQDNNRLLQMQMNEKILNGVTEYREKSLEALNRNSRDASREHMRVSQSPLRSLNRTENPSP
jgi:hypothetical protein